MASHLGWGESQEGAGHHDRNARKFPRGDAWRSRQLLVGAMLPLLLASCKGADKGVAVESSRHALVVGSTVAYEAEVLTRTASATGSQVTSEAGASAGQYVQLSGTPSAGAWVEFTLPNVEAGSYDVKVLYKSNYNRGIVQASIDGVNQGSPCDQYAWPGVQQVACSLGSKALTGGSHTIRFTVTAKNRSSAGYMMVIDQISLTATGTGDAGGSCLSNWRDTTCGQWCTRETQYDRKACEVFLECYRTTGTGPTNDPDGTCGVNRFHYGTAPKTIADQVYQCLACPGSTPVTSCSQPLVPDTTPCTDRNPCTQGDRCESGQCRPGPTCGTGYRCDANGAGCVDIDECATGAANCAPDATCTNTPGAFTCTCNSGYQGDGITCTDIDECATGAANCDANAICKNTPGGFTCTCQPGYQGDGTTCTYYCTPITVGPPPGTTRCVADRSDGTIELYRSAYRTEDCGTLTCDDASADSATCADILSNCYKQQYLQKDEPEENMCGPTSGKNFLYWYGMDHGMDDPSYATMASQMGWGWATNDLMFLCANICTPLNLPCIATCYGLPQGFTDAIGKFGTLTGELDKALDDMRPVGYVRCKDTRHLSYDQLRWSLSHGNPVIFDESRGQWNLHWAMITGIYLDSTGQLKLRIANSPPDVTWDEFLTDWSIESVCTGSDLCGIAKGFLMDYVGIEPHVYRWTKVGETSPEMGCPDPYLRASSVAAGDFFGCGVLSDAAGVACWGNNSEGQLGLQPYQSGQFGGPTGTAYHSSPVAVAGTSGATAVAAGSEFACALKSDGKVSCWGSNSAGQLGKPLYNSNPLGGSSQGIVRSITPLEIAGLSDVTAISAGSAFACALRSDGRVFCWGSNTAGPGSPGGGQLGISHVDVGMTDGTPYSIAPREISGLSDTTAIATGSAFACALKSDGKVFCWGSNTAGAGDPGGGQLGISHVDVGMTNGTPYSITPRQINGLPSATAITAGSNHACAVVWANSSVFCWGSNSTGAGNPGGGQLGVSPVEISAFQPAAPFSITPLQIARATYVTKLVAGSGHVCALISDGGVSCWGSNSSDPGFGGGGQLGIEPLHTEVVTGQESGTPYSTKVVFVPALLSSP